jgi:hypothetical protein
VAWFGCAYFEREGKAENSESEGGIEGVGGGIEKERGEERERQRMRERVRMRESRAGVQPGSAPAPPAAAPEEPAPPPSPPPRHIPSVAVAVTAGGLETTRSHARPRIAHAGVPIVFSNSRNLTALATYFDHREGCSALPMCSCWSETNCRCPQEEFRSETRAYSYMNWNRNCL